MESGYVCLLGFPHVGSRMEERSSETINTTPAISHKNPSHKAPSPAGEGWDEGNTKHPLVIITPF